MRMIKKTPRPLRYVLDGVPMIIIGTKGDIDSACGAKSLINITREASNIMINGPAVINEKTWIKMMGQPYTPGLD